MLLLLPALQHSRLHEFVPTRIDREPARGREEGDSDRMDEKICAILEELYTKRFPDSPMDALKADCTALASGPPVTVGIS